jgi:hypothetical protein
LRRFLNDPLLFLNFCDYLPFEEDLVHDLYNFKFPLPKGDLYQVWLKLAIDDSGEEYFFPNINTCKNDFPHYGPTRPQGTMICIKLNFHYIRKLLCKSELLWLFGSKEEDF